MKKIVNYISSSPKIRLGVTLFGGMAPGFFLNVYAAEVAPGGVINWSFLLSASSFKPLLGSMAAWFVVNLIFLGHDKDVAEFADDAHCLAYVRKARLEAYVQVVRNNPERADLMDAKALLKELNIKKP